MELQQEKDEVRAAAGECWRSVGIKLVVVKGTNLKAQLYVAGPAFANHKRQSGQIHNTEADPVFAQSHGGWTSGAHVIHCAPGKSCINQPESYLWCHVWECPQRICISSHCHWFWPLFSFAILCITATITETLLLTVPFFTTPPHPLASQHRLFLTLPPFPPLGHLCMHLNTTGLTEVLKCKVHDMTRQSLSDRANEPRNTEQL